MELLNRDEAFSKIRTSDTYILYLFTPMCGTCQVAEKILGVIEAMQKGIPLGKTDINYIPELAKEIGVESVPCLLLIKKGKVQQKIYAFQSVPDLLIKVNAFFTNR